MDPKSIKAKVLKNDNKLATNNSRIKSQKSVTNSSFASEINRKCILKEKEYPNQAIAAFNELKTMLTLLGFPFKDSKVGNAEKFVINIFDSAGALNSIFNQILHFLLVNMSIGNEEWPEDIKQSLMLCYPVITLTESKQFKDKTYEIIKKLEQSKYLPENILVGKSILENPTGSKVVFFLFELAVAVLQSKCKSNGYRILDNWKDIPEDYIKTHIAIQTDKLVDTTYNIDMYQKECKELFSKLIQNEESIKKEVNDSNRRISELMKRGILKQEDEVTAINRMVKIDHFNIYFSNLQQISEKLLESNKVDSLYNILYDIDSGETLGRDKFEISSSLSNSVSLLKSRDEEADVLLLDSVPSQYNAKLKEILQVEAHSSSMKIKKDQSKLLEELNLKILSMLSKLDCKEDSENHI